MKEIWVIKRDGKIERFSRDKVLRSLLRVGLSESEAWEVLTELEKILPEMTTTRYIHRVIKNILSYQHPHAKHRYTLKQAIMKLGPEGYPFEKYFAKLLETQGYRVRTNIIFEGRCVSHEVDVVAEKNDKRYMVECKYHNSQGIYTGIKVALYVKARLEDLSEYFDNAWLATNTKFSEEAIQYVQCVGMKATAWSYPPGEALEDLVEKTRLYPLTILDDIPRRFRVKLLKAGMVTLRDFVSAQPRRLAEITGLSEHDIEVLQKKGRIVLEK
ncbi:MAG: hypothetical protein DRJ35_02780 [Thermoprotei archaeon]|nr:MAG: hypothetical protein DRJ35_02780 [Thermoprotei archaeon]